MQIVKIYYRKSRLLDNHHISLSVLIAYMCAELESKYGLYC